MFHILLVTVAGFRVAVRFPNLQLAYRITICGRVLFYFSSGSVWRYFVI